MCDGRRCSQGFCGARAALNVYGENRSENGVSGTRNQPATGTAFGSGDGERNTSDKCPRGSRKAVNPYTWLVCAKIVKWVRGEREPTQGITFSAGHEPTQDSAFGEGIESNQSSAFGVGYEPTRCGVRADPRQCFRRGARAHPNLPLGSARRERAARWSVGGRYRYPQQGWGLSNPRG